METTHFYGPKAYHEFLRISASPSLKILKNTRILAGSENTRITYRDTLITNEQLGLPEENQAEAGEFPMEAGEGGPAAEEAQKV
jgi:hypothetical protein